MPRSSFSFSFLCLSLLSDIGGTLYGPWMRFAILTSITISQIGFVAAYTIFVSQNLQVCSYIVILLIAKYLPSLGIRNGNNELPSAHLCPVFHFDTACHLPPTCPDPKSGKVKYDGACCRCIYIGRFDIYLWERDGRYLTKWSGGSQVIQFKGLPASDRVSRLRFGLAGILKD